MDQRHNSHVDYSTLEVDQSANLPQAKPSDDLPEVKPNHNYPELAYDAENYPVPVVSGEPGKRQAICGLRKKTFWSALTVVVLVVIGIAVGVGVGASATKSSSSSGESRGANSTTTSQRGRVASFSHLAASNYTDPQERVHSQVFFQDSSLGLWMANFDTTQSEWSVSEINTTTQNPKNGTPIAAWSYFNTAKAEKESEFAVRFVDGSTNYVRTRYVMNRMINSDWIISPSSDNLWEVTDDSSIGGYSVQCHDSPSCSDGNFFVFRHVDDGETHTAYPYNSNYSFNSFQETNITADNGTAYALTTIAELPADNHSWVAMYLSVNSKLREFYWSSQEDPMWSVSNMNVNLTIDSGSQLAAMSYRLNDLRYVQVLITHEEGGVMMAYLDGGPDKRWAETTSVSGMENVLPLSPIAANPIGRVYAMEEVDGRAEIVEWKRTSETGTPMFERVGVVSPTPSTT